MVKGDRNSTTSLALGLLNYWGAPDTMGGGSILIHLVGITAKFGLALFRGSFRSWECFGASRARRREYRLGNYRLTTNKICALVAVKSKNCIDWITSK